MRDEELWDGETAKAYDTPGTGMFAPEVLGPTVDRLAELAGGGRVLEFAIGTGRVAVPLNERGVAVTGIEMSTAMIEQLRTEVGEATIPVIVGDMATTSAPARFALLYLVYNTISNLLTQEEQVECFRNAARHLEPGARGSGPSGCPARPLVSYQINRQLSGWNPPPLVIRPFGAHCHHRTFLFASSSFAEGFVTFPGSE